MDSIQRLTYIATAAGLDNRLYLDEHGTLAPNRKAGSATALVALAQEALQEAGNQESRAIVHAAADRLVTHLDAKLDSINRPIVFLVGPLFRKKIKGLKKVREELQGMKDASSDSRAIRTEASARIRLFKTFKTRFPARLLSPNRPRSPSIESLVAEGKLIEIVSRRIFNAARNDKQYEDWMSHFIRGSHMIFEHEKGRLTLAKELQDALEEDTGRYREGAESSHYKHEDGKNRFDHHRISGFALLSEILVCPDETLARNNQGTLVTGKLYNENDRRKGYGEQHVTAIHTENFSGGPVTAVILPPGRQEDEAYWSKTLPFYLTRTLPHRTHDFILYALRKKIGCKEPNVSKHGVGVADNNAIVIPANRKET